jgi:hypothetical protein
MVAIISDEATALKKREQLNLSTQWVNDRYEISVTTMVKPLKIF